jgi:glycosyltransferase involved in cell wall biosynthesis
VAGLMPHVLASGAGVGVEPTVAAIRSGILDLLARRDQWEFMGRFGRDYALHHLRWDSIAAQAISFYDQIGN